MCACTSVRAACLERAWQYSMQRGLGTEVRQIPPALISTTRSVRVLKHPYSECSGQNIFNGTVSDVDTLLVVEIFGGEKAPHLCAKSPTLSVDEKISAISAGQSTVSSADCLFACAPCNSCLSHPPRRRGRVYSRVVPDVRFGRSRACAGVYPCWVRPRQLAWS